MSSQPTPRAHFDTLVNANARHRVLIRSSQQLRRLLPIPHLRFVQGSQDVGSRSVDAMAHVLGRFQHLFAG